MSDPCYVVLAPTGPAIPLIVHIPHDSTVIPSAHRAAILLDDAALRTEHVRMTDWHTDRLFDWAADVGATALVNRVSRLVVDPERFANDAAEPMARVGQGAVYTRTADGAPLRADDPAARAALIRDLYDPYHAAFSRLVAQILECFESCTILDGHSFGTVPLPSEHDQSADRPDICIGTDAFHTPPALAADLVSAFSAAGFRTALDTPFTGAIVPLDRFGSDPRVRSVMVEVRRGLYCDELTGAPLPSFDALRARIRDAVTRALDR